MTSITKRLTPLLYLGEAPLVLSSLPANVKSAIKLIRQLNGAGTGYVSFNPASGVNSLTQLISGGAQGHVVIEASSATPNFLLDGFGSWPLPGNNQSNLAYMLSDYVLSDYVT
jgi:hypothetical protein